MNSSFLASLLHVAANKDKIYHHSYCPIGPDSWCKYNTDRANNNQTCKPEPGLPKDIIYKTTPIFFKLSKDTELEKCLHSKIQNAN